MIRQKGIALEEGPKSHALLDRRKGRGGRGVLYRAQVYGRLGIFYREEGGSTRLTSCKEKKKQKMREAV